jgi:hypothetical protein
MSNLKNTRLRKDTGDLLKASYLPQKEASKKMELKGYKYDPQLSSMASKVYVSPDGKPVITYRGTKTVKDVIDDGLVALGLGKFGFKYKGAQRLAKKVEDKYKQPADVVSHSYGAWLGENSGAHGNIITYNKAVGLGDINRKKNSKQLDISTKGDLVSALGVTQNANKEVIDNKFKSKDPFKNALNSHNLDNLFNNQNEPEPVDKYFDKASEK